MKIAFSEARTDRSGSIIQFLFEYQYYAYHHGTTYGGSCHIPSAHEGPLDGYYNDNDPKEHMNEHDQAAESLLELVGLDRVLPFACPSSHQLQDEDIEIVWLDKDKVKHEWRRQTVNKIRAWSEELLEPHVMAAMARHDEADKKTKSPETLDIAIHLRRGDVAPCANFHRYISNVFYESTAERVMVRNGRQRPNNSTSILPDNTKVTVFTEPEYKKYKHEEFANLGYDMEIGGSVDDVWKGIIRSDVAIISNSAFSIILALLKFGRGRVIYFEEILHDFPTQPHWEPPADPDIVEEAKAKGLSLHEKFCKKRKKQ